MQPWRARLIAVAMLTGILIAVAAPMALADKNCPDFQYQEDAQAYFNEHGGSASNNFDDLDRDHNGVACQDLPHRAAAASTPAPAAAPAAATPAPAPAAAASASGDRTLSNTGAPSVTFAALGMLVLTMGALMRSWSRRRILVPPLHVGPGEWIRCRRDGTVDRGGRYGVIERLR